MKFLPEDYQKIGIKFVLKNPASGLLMAPGLGKTMCILTAFDTLHTKGIVNKMLIISKLSIIDDVWPGEISKWGLSYKYASLGGLPNNSVDVIQDKSIQIVGINFESLVNFQKLLFSVKNLRYAFDMGVVDESTKIKTLKAKRFGAIRKLAPLMKRRHILTGTPVPNSLLDIYAQVWYLDLGHSLGYKTQFKNEFFTPCGYKGYDSMPIDGAEEKIFNKLKHLLIRFDDSNLKLPKEVVLEKLVKLTPKLAKQYKELEKEYILELEEGTITAANAAAKTMKLRQFVNGNIYDENGKTIDIHGLKLTALEDLIEGLNGKPAFVGYEFNHDLERLKKLFPKAKVIGGGMKKAELNMVIKAWNAGRIPVLFAQIEAASHGLNLQEVDAAVIFYGVTWNLENYIQFIRRIRRKGSKAKRTFIYRIVVENTIDMLMLDRLEKKDLTQKRLLDIIKAHMKASGLMPKKKVAKKKASKKKIRRKKK